nr:MAG TPA: hypothetical protein [Caudoviricetes sp.]
MGLVSIFIFCRFSRMAPSLVHVYLRIFRYYISDNVNYVYIRR